MPYKGPLPGIVHQLVGGLRQAMGYCGAGDDRGDEDAHALHPHHVRRACARATRTTSRSRRTRRTTARAGDPRGRDRRDRDRAPPGRRRLVHPEPRRHRVGDRCGRRNLVRLRGAIGLVADAGHRRARPASWRGAGLLSPRERAGRLPGAVGGVRRDRRGPGAPPEGLGLPALPARHRPHHRGNGRCALRDPDGRYALGRTGRSTTRSSRRPRATATPSPSATDSPAEAYADRPPIRPARSPWPELFPDA